MGTDKKEQSEGNSAVLKLTTEMDAECSFLLDLLSLYVLL